jgi:UDP-2-acetamido-2-deoxy-ribo-hexuluronate aminotransferase
MNIPLLDLLREYQYLKTDVDAAIARALEHQHWILGPEVQELEEKIAAYIGVSHAIGVASGTDALLLALRALALKRKGTEFFDRDDEIITTPFTFVATADTILHAGATPVFADIQPDTFNLDPKEVEKAITPKTVGVIPVHLYGQSCDMDPLLALAKKHGLFILEDCAQSFGDEYKSRKTGSIGAIAAFSFFPSTNLPACGDAGMIATRDPQLAELVGILRKHGGKDKYNVEVLGYNSRLDTLQAAILLAKFPHIDDFNRRRRAIAAAYTQALSVCETVATPTEAGWGAHAYHQYTLRVRNGRRDSLMNHLKAAGVDTAVYYPVPLHKMKLLQGRCRSAKSIGNTEQAAMEVLSLPIEPLLTDTEINQVISSTQTYS